MGRAFVDSYLVVDKESSTLRTDASSSWSDAFVLSHRLFQLGARPRPPSPCVYAPFEVALARELEPPPRLGRASVPLRVAPPGRAPVRIDRRRVSRVPVQPLPPAGDGSLRTRREPRRRRRRKGRFYSLSRATRSLLSFAEAIARNNDTRAPLCVAASRRVQLDPPRDARERVELGAARFAVPHVDRGRRSVPPEPVVKGSTLRTTRGRLRRLAARFEGGSTSGGVSIGVGFSFGPGGRGAAALGDGVRTTTSLAGDICLLLPEGVSGGGRPEGSLGARRSPERVGGVVRPRRGVVGQDDRADVARARRRAAVARDDDGVRVAIGGARAGLPGPRRDGGERPRAPLVRQRPLRGGDVARGRREGRCVVVAERDRALAAVPARAQARHEGDRTGGRNAPNRAARDDRSGPRGMRDAFRRARPGGGG